MAPFASWIGIVSPAKSTNSFSPALYVCRQGKVERLHPRAVAHTEGMFPVLIPQKLQRDMLSLQLVIEVLEGRHVPPLYGERDTGRKEEMLHTSIIQIVGKRSAKTCSLCPVKIFFDRGSPDTAALRCLPGRKTASPTESDYFFHLAHR